MTRSLDVPKYWVGLNEPVEDFERLCGEKKDEKIKIIAIFGMGRSGKTIVAKLKHLVCEDYPKFQSIDEEATYLRSLWTLLKLELDQRLAMRMHDHLCDLGRKMADELSPPHPWRPPYVRSLDLEDFEKILSETNGQNFRCLHSIFDSSSIQKLHTFLGIRIIMLRHLLHCYGLSLI